MTTDTLFYLRRKELINILIVVIAIGFLLNILAQLIWEEYLRQWEAYLVFGLIILLLMILLLGYFTLFIAKGYEQHYVAEFFLVRRIGKEIPEQSIIPGYTGLWYAQYALRTLALKSPEFNQKVIQFWDCLSDPICLDLMEYILIKWLGDKYRNGWLIEKRLSLEEYSDKKVLNRRATTIELNNLKDLLKRNIFFKLLDEQYYRLCLPPNTKIDRHVAKIHWTNPCREFIFKNKYCSVIITFQNTWQINRLFEDLRPFLLHNYQKETEYQTHYYQIQVRAKFNRWLIALPQMDNYYRWVNDLMMKIKNDFDWSHYVRERIN
jgi:hypothetical protein